MYGGEQVVAPPPLPTVQTSTNFVTLWRFMPSFLFDKSLSNLVLFPILRQRWWLTFNTLSMSKVEKIGEGFIFKVYQMLSAKKERFLLRTVL